ncbi:unnamed protein product [marine sediment metagenome]|uniref:Uncharacterized protein n=1 Tax=marine sediment metagenome TaxID=412755 RepID=X0UDF9_9ZZZZ
MMTKPQAARLFTLAILQLTTDIDSIELGGKPFGSVGGFERDQLVEERKFYYQLLAKLEK